MFFFFANTKLLIFGNFYFIIGKSLNSFYIKEIKEDEAIAYFIRFSNDDILHIYEYVDGLEDWFLDFEIVSPENENYNEIITHMNETWVNRIL